MSSAPPTRSARLSLVVDALTGVLLLVAIGLLGAQYFRSQEPARPNSPGAVPADSLLPALAVKDSASVDTLFRVGARNRLVLVFRTDCAVCARQKASWVALGDSLSARGWEVVALTPEPYSPEVAKYFSAPVVTRSLVTPGDLTTALGTTAVPTTIAAVGGRHIAYYHVGFAPEADLSGLRTLP